MLAVIVWAPESATWLEKTLEPLVVGPDRPDEIVILAAALSDEATEVLAAYGRRHPDLRVLRGTRTLASFDRAVLHGLEAVSARWVMLLASGDVVLPGALRRAIALANEHPSAGAVLARAATFDPAGALATACRGIPGRASPGFETPARFRELSLGGDDPLGHAIPRAALLRREALVAFALRPALGPLALPMAAWLLAAVHGAACLPEPLVDDQGPPSDLNLSLAEDPGAFLEPLRRLEDLGSFVPAEDARRLREHVHRRILTSARATLARACHSLERAAKVIEAGGSLGDRVLARLLELTLARARSPEGK
jgi:hypothetical protein